MMWSCYFLLIGLIGELIVVGNLNFGGDIGWSCKFIGIIRAFIAEFSMAYEYLTF